MKRHFRTQVNSAFFRPFSKKIQDPRVAKYPLMNNPLWNTVSVLLYLYIVYYGGPTFMKNRKPFEFRRFLFLYNMALVALSGWMFYEVNQSINNYENK